jgi:hypothetical protein
MDQKARYRLSMTMTGIRDQRTTSPLGDKVKPINTPRANRGMRVLVSPPTDESLRCGTLVGATTRTDEPAVAVRGLSGLALPDGFMVARADPHTRSDALAV